jgi:hypothetical protein
MTFFSSGVIGFGADAAIVAEAIPNPFFFDTSRQLAATDGQQGDA